MDFFTLIGTVSLVFQVAVFVLLLGGWTLKKMRRFRLHGLFMLVGVLLHLAIIFAIMVPSFLAAFLPMILTDQFGLNTVLSSIHGVLGASAAALGVWLVFGWHLRSDLDYCLPKKRFMRYTFYVWFAALSFGFILYLSLFWSTLFG